MGAGRQLLNRQVDVGAADVLVEERRTLGQLDRIDVALQGSNDRSRGEVGRIGAGESLLRMERAEPGAEGRSAAGRRRAPRARAAAVPSRPRASRRV